MYHRYEVKTRMFVEAKTSAGRWSMGLRPDLMMIMVCKPHYLFAFLDIGITYLRA